MEPEEVVFDAENTMCKIYLKLHLKEALLAATFFYLFNYFCSVTADFD